MPCGDWKRKRKEEGGADGERRSPGRMEREGFLSRPRTKLIGELVGQLTDRWTKEKAGSGRTVSDW